MSVIPAQTFGTDILVRSAEEQDAAAVVAYLNEVAGETDYLSFGAGDYYRDAAQQAAMIRSHRETDGELYVLAQSGGRIAGHLSFTLGARPRTRHSGEFGMAVRKDYWRRGIGRRLLELLVEFARSSPAVHKVNLRTRADNAAAIRLYEQLGFEQEGRIRDDNVSGGRLYDALWMGLIVGNANLPDGPPAR